MTRPALRAVLFDWDGTLADTALATYRCYGKLFATHGIVFDEDAFRRTYSPNWHHTYAAMGLPRERWDEADAEWLRHYAEEHATLLPGAREAVGRVAAAGLATAVVTSGDGVRVGRELRELGLFGRFRVVVSAEHIVHRKPHPEALLLALARLEIAPAEAAYVGDTPEDMEMAKAGGVLAVGVPGPYPTHDALRAARPDLLCASVSAAVDALLDGAAAGPRPGRL